MITGARRTRGVYLAGVLAMLSSLTSCDRPNPNRMQGYVEGEYVYIASPMPGTLSELFVQRGAQVAAGDPLFALDDAPERSARDEAERRLAQARANLDDVTKGKRPTEIASLTAQVEQARSALTFSQGELVRQEKLILTRATSAEELDRVRATVEQDRERVAQFEADLKTAQLGARSDQITAADAYVHALEATLAKAEWDLAQTRQAAPQAAVVFDTLYRPGEWVAAGRPIVALLPPQNIKVRAFVPEGRIGSLHIGDPVRITVDGVAKPAVGKLSFVSPKAEYTPPVIYSQENRHKLVFMVEAVFDPAVAATLHPGQPVDMTFGSP